MYSALKRAMKVRKGINMERIETERLILRQFEFSDKDDLFEIMSDEQTSLDDGGYHASKSQDQQYLALMEILCRQQRFSIILKENQKMIGMINLQDDNRAVSSYELGFVMNPNYRRRGYTYEAVQAVMNYYFEHNLVQMFSVSCFPYNKASLKLIEKLGFVYEGREHKGLNHAVYGPIDLLCYYKDKDE